MDLRGIFADRSGVFQLFILALTVVVGLILAQGAFLLICSALYGGFNPFALSPSILRLNQFLAAFFAFLLPAFTCAFLFSKKPADYLYISSFPRLKVLLGVLLCLFLFSPVVNLAGILNKTISLPSFMEGIEQWMQDKEATMEKMVETLLAGSGILILLANLLVVAVMAGIAEEFLFRAVLQRIFSKVFNNYHIVIWVVAFLFSVFHFQFYGLLPRMLLGALFGYLLYWSRNIWVPVFGHFGNNAFGVIGMSRSEWKENQWINGEISTEVLWQYGIVALIFCWLGCVCLGKLRKEFE